LFSAELGKLAAGAPALWPAKIFINQSYGPLLVKIAGHAHHQPAG